MKLNPHQTELLRLNPDLDARDIPADWWGASELDEKIQAKRVKRLAAEAAAARPTPQPVRPKSKRLVTQKDLLDTIELVAKCVADITGPLKRRIAELEARPAFDYTGLHVQGRSYRKGQGCTQGGSIWIAMKDYPAAPGTPDSGWQLAVKRGRDAR